MIIRIRNSPIPGSNIMPIKNSKEVWTFKVSVLCKCLPVKIYRVSRVEDLKGINIFCWRPWRQFESFQLSGVFIARSNVGSHVQERLKCSLPAQWDCWCPNRHCFLLDYGTAEITSSLVAREAIRKQKRRMLKAEIRTGGPCPHGGRGALCQKWQGAAMEAKCGFHGRFVLY